MKTINLKQILFTFTLITILNTQSHAATEGGMHGGGGKGVVCRNTDGSIKSVELLDLWEAREIYGREINYSDEPVEKQYKEALTSLRRAIPKFDVSDSQEFSWILSHSYLEGGTANSIFKQINKKNFKLPDTNDAYEEFLPDESTGCRIEQIVTVFDLEQPRTSKANINSLLYDKLDNTSKAALNLHESLYAALRIIYGEDNSKRTRRAIGAVFSGLAFSDVARYLIKPRVVCSQNNEFGYPVSVLQILQSDSGDFLMTPVITNGQIWLGAVGKAGLTLGKIKSYNELIEKLNNSGVDSHGEIWGEYKTGVNESPIDYEKYLIWTISGKNEISVYRSRKDFSQKKPLILNCVNKESSEEI
jgi:hypothetical protein